MMSKIRGIMATTHVDRHNEKVGKEGLQGSADQINKHDRIMWINWNHQTTLPPIGMVDKAWVEPLEDGEFSLVFEGTLFSNREEFVIAREFDIDPKEVEQLGLIIEGLGLSHDPRNFRDDDINQTIELLGKEIAVEHRHYLRKSEVPQSVIWIIVGFIGGGIGTGILNRVGEKIADKAMEATKPTLSKIGNILSNLIEKTIQGDQPDYIFLLQIPGVKENVEGALECPSSSVLKEACEKLPELYSYTLKILSQNQPEYFQDIKFLFNPKNHQWEINYLTLKKSQKIILGKRYYEPEHPLRIRYEQELMDLKVHGKMEKK